MNTPHARRRLVACLILTVAGVAACDAGDRRAAEYGCALCLILGQGAAESVVTPSDVDDVLEPSCGECAEGERCNMLMDPPTCAPYPLREGATCGRWDLPEERYLCDDEMEGTIYEGRTHCGTWANVAFRCARGLRCSDPLRGECARDVPNRGEFP